MFNIMILIFLVLGFKANGQTGTDDSTDVILPDTICYKLKFTPGDTLIYGIVSHDSIAINYEQPILKIRYERMEIVCDSVKANRYFLSQKLLQYAGRESSGEIKNVERNTCPWEGRKVWYSIDSSGNRYDLGYENDSVAALSGGGAFQPQLIFPMGKSCHKVDETWMAASTDELAENGFPVPLLRQSSLFRALPKIDTLGELCNRLNYIKTGQGSYSVKSQEDTLRVTNIITGYGVLDISSDNNIPVHYMATVEQKLTISIGNEETKPGWHYILSNYTLESYKKGTAAKNVNNKKK